MTQVIFANDAGYLHLGRSTPYGVQVDIENFLRVEDAQRWCYRHGLRTAEFQVGDVGLTVRQCLLLQEVDERGRAASLQELAAGLAQREADLKAGQDPAPLAIVKGIALDLESKGVVAITRPHGLEAKGQAALKTWRIAITPAGSAFLTQILG